MPHSSTSWLVASTASYLLSFVIFKSHSPPTLRKVQVKEKRQRNIIWSKRPDPPIPLLLLLLLQLAAGEYQSFKPRNSFPTSQVRLRSWRILKKKKGKIVHLNFRYYNSVDFGPYRTTRKDSTTFPDRIRRMKSASLTSGVLKNACNVLNNFLVARNRSKHASHHAILSHYDVLNSPCSNFSVNRPPQAGRLLPLHWSQAQSLNMSATSEQSSEPSSLQGLPFHVYSNHKKSPHCLTFQCSLPFGQQFPTNRHLP